MKISYNWLKWYVPEVVEADKLADVLTYHLTEVESVTPLLSGEGAGGEVGKIEDWIFDLNILPNRAHDLLSHHGVAREIAGQLGIKFNDPTPKYKIPPAPDKGRVGEGLKIEINTENCRRYMGRIVRNVKVGPSPDWVVAHLASIGQRSINNIVDATNIVMFDCGQPCHAYDLDKVSSHRSDLCEIKIQNAKEGEELAVVGRDRIVAKLKSTDMVICTPSPLQGEGRGEVLNLALAGVKGGLDSGISESTTDIVLEVANFNPTSVRKTARRLGLLSDSAKRFENDLSSALCDFGMLELSALFVEMCPNATFEEIVDMYPVKQEEKKISFTTEMVNKKLGSNITDSEVETILKNYNFSFSKIPSPLQGEGVGGEVYEVVAPPLRLDLNIPEDMVEEIGRVYGYDKVVGTIPKINFVPDQNEIYTKILTVRDDLIQKGYREVMTYAFTDKGEVEVLASASDKNFLRTNLSDGLKKSYEMNKLNAPLLETDEVKIFEIGNVFTKPARAGGNGEELHVAYADKKGVKEVKLDEYASPEIVSERSSDLLSSRLTPQAGQTVSDPIPSSAFKLWSPYPFITRDIAVWVPEGTDAKVLEDIYKKNGGELMALAPRLVDTFTKDGRTSYAFRLVFQAMDRTLTDSEVNSIMENINQEIFTHTDFEIR